MAISTLFPTTRPSLSLDFAKSRRLDPRIAFSRVQTGNIASYTDSNGLIRYAGPDEPRFDHDPITGESLGLLVEEGRTNYAFESNMITGWSIIGLALNLDTTGPDGAVNSAVSLTEGTTNPGQHVVYKDFNVVNNNQIFTHSFFVKPALRTEWQLNIHNVGSVSDVSNINVIYNTSTETFTTAVVGGPSPDKILVEYGAIKYPNGWYRIWVTGNTGSSDLSTTNLRFHIRSLSNGTSAYTGSGQVAGYIFGAQLELGNFLTSYIPTSGSAVDRPDDIVSLRNLGTSDWWDKQVDSFSMVLEWDSPITLDPSIHGPVFGYFTFWSNSTNYDNRIGIPLPHTTSTRFLTRAFGSGNAIFNNGTVDASSQEQLKKMAFSWSIPDYSNHTSKSWKIFFNSGDSSATIAGNSFGTTPPDIQRLGIGNNPTRFDESPGVKTFKKLTFYNSVLTDFQLQTLTK